MKHYLEKRSMRIAGHRTSVALEPEFWRSIEASAKAQKCSLPVLMASLDAAKKPGQTLASACRVHALNMAEVS